jgi:hypothetical protein
VELKRVPNSEQQGLWQQDRDERATTKLGNMVRIVKPVCCDRLDQGNSLKYSKAANLIEPLSSVKGKSASRWELEPTIVREPINGEPCRSVIDMVTGTSTAGTG